MNLNKSKLPTEEILPLKSEAPLIIYIDLKSPYAYLSISPTRKMLAKLGLIADWRPFVLDIPSYLGSAKLDKGGKEVTKQNRTKEQWSDVKYAYFDCRRYANLNDKTIRGTVKIWNTDLPAIGMLWIKSFTDLTEQCSKGSLLERYIDGIFDSFWNRELDAEDLSMILQVLERVDAPTDGFLEYAKTEGVTLNARLQQSAFDAGIYGVPTFILLRKSEADSQHEKFFGREHLPRINWLLSGHKGPAPDVAYNLTSEVDDVALTKSAVEPSLAPELNMTPNQLNTFFDFKSPHSYLALKNILALKDEGISICWRPFSGAPLKVPPAEVAREDRSTKHRRLRAEYNTSDIQRYAPHYLKEVHRKTDCRFADMGLLWLQKELQINTNIIDEYVQRVFVHLWRDGGSIGTIQDIELLLIAIEGVQTDFNNSGHDLEFTDAWKKYTQGRGLKHLDEARAEAKSKSINMAPTFLIGSEPFKGRAHLPLIIARFKAGI